MSEHEESANDYKYAEYIEPDLLEKEKLELNNDIFAGKDNRRGRPEYFMPKGTEVLKIFDYLEIDLMPKSGEKKGKWVFFILTFLWNIIAFTVLGTSLLSGNFLVVFFLLIFVVIGLVFLGNTLSLFFNRKKIKINQEKMIVEISPFTFGKSKKEYDLKDIRQFYVSKYFTGITINDKPLMAYALSAITQEWKTLKLIDNSNLESVLYLEQELERFLGIKDEKVSGEILE